MHNTPLPVTFAKSEDGSYPSKPDTGKLLADDPIPLSIKDLFHQYVNYIDHRQCIFTKKALIKLGLFAIQDALFQPIALFINNDFTVFFGKGF